MTSRFIAAGAAVLAATVAGWIVFARSTAPPYLQNTLTVDQARSLVEAHDGQPFLYLHHLTSLTPDVAAVLADAEGGLIFSRLTTLSPESAAALTRHEGSLSFPGLTTLSAAAAREFSRYQGASLSLENLQTLSTEAAASLRENTAIRFPQR